MANSDLFLCYAMNKELAGPDQGPVDGLGLCLACELVTGPGTVVGAERNRGLWLIYLKSQSAKDAIIIEGRPKQKECTNPKENNRYDASTPHIHLHLQKPIKSMKRRGERLERDQSKMRKARALGLGEGQDHNNSK